MLLVFVADFSTAVHCRDKLLIQILLQKKKRKRINFKQKENWKKTQQCELDFFSVTVQYFRSIAINNLLSCLRSITSTFFLHYCILLPMPRVLLRQLHLMYTVLGKTVSCSCWKGCLVVPVHWEAIKSILQLCKV